MDGPERGAPAGAVKPIEIRIGPEVPLLWRLSLAWVILITLFTGIYVARAVLLPLVFAFLLSFLLRPVTRLLHRLHIPEVFGAGMVVITLVAAVAAAVVLLAEPARAWVERAPQVMAQVESRLHEVTRTLRKVSEATAQVEQLAAISDDPDAAVVQLRGSQLSDLILGRTWQVVATVVIMVFLLYFLLASGDLFLRKLVHVLPRLQDKRRAVAIARQIESDVSTYLFTVSLINTGLGVVVGLLMYWLGMPNPVLWGVMAGLLNFIPYLGPAVTLVVLATVALISFDNSGEALIRPAVFLVTTTIEGQLITPMILGHRLQLNPVVIFVSLIFWAWLWGIPGGLLAVPLTMVFKILCDAIPPLGPVGHFLSR